jgi:NAD(P)-dependent dehydrogenase (short-subunit alcohol dehydrogenase family)
MLLDETVAALVTGGASGLGQATVRRLVAAGAKVVIADLPGSAGAEVAAELGDAVAFMPTDVRDEDQVGAALDTAGRLGALRVVVNCAGVATVGRMLGRNGPLRLSEFQRVIDINLVGTFNVLRLASERIAALEPVGEERGVLICTASIAAYEGQIGQPAYSASKGGVASMTIAVARELAARQIRVMTIAPGPFATAMLAGLPDEVQASLGAQIPHPSRLGRPEEYAALVAAIVANPMLNGETIRLDGAVRLAPK